MPQESDLNAKIDALTSKYKALVSKLEALESRMDATIKVQNFLLEAHEMEDLFSHDFTAEQVKDAGGFLSAYLGRRGPIRHLDLEGILARIKACHCGNRGGIEPTLPGTESVRPRGIVNANEAGKGIGLAHAPEAEASEPRGQVTTALTVLQLARRMSEHAARALDPETRYSDEDDDRVMLGKLTALDAICEPLWMDDRLTEAEDKQLRSAKAYADRAWNHLKNKLDDA